jgi:hypothetical protein
MIIRVKHRDTEIEIIKEGFYQSDYSSTKENDSKSIVIPELTVIIDKIMEIIEAEKNI